MENLVKKSLFTILIIIVILFLSYFINNYNSNIIYIYTGSNGGFSASGNITLSKQINIININTAFYTANDIKVKSVRVELVYLKNNKEQFIMATSHGDNSNILLKDYLEKFRFTHTESYGYEEIFTRDMIKNLNNLLVKIIYVDENNNENIYKINLKGIKYSNNKLFYKKSEQID